MREFDREQLLALTPDRYLAEGWVDGSGAPRRELMSDYATAAATQLLAGGLAPQELGFTVAALEQVLPLNDTGTPASRLAASLEETLETVGRMIGQPNNESLVEWLISCAATVRTRADLDAFMAHLHAVLRLYSVLASMPEPGSSSEPS
jgi:hypothetical protein